MKKWNKIQQNRKRYPEQETTIPTRITCKKIPCSSKLSDGVLLKYDKHLWIFLGAGNSEVLTGQSK